MGVLIKHEESSRTETKTRSNRKQPVPVKKDSLRLALERNRGRVLLIEGKVSLVSVKGKHYRYRLLLGPDNSIDQEICILSRKAFEISDEQLVVVSGRVVPFPNGELGLKDASLVLEFVAGQAILTAT